MSTSISRRRLFVTGAIGLGGLALGGCDPLTPPSDASRIIRPRSVRSAWPVTVMIAPAGAAPCATLTRAGASHSLARSVPRMKAPGRASSASSRNSQACRVARWCQHAACRRAALSPIHAAAETTSAKTTRVAGEWSCAVAGLRARRARFAPTKTEASAAPAATTPPSTAPAARPPTTHSPNHATSGTPPSRNDRGPMRAQRTGPRPPGVHRRYVPSGGCRGDAPTFRIASRITTTNSALLWSITSSARVTTDPRRAPLV